MISLAILGPGLLGGSIALAARARGGYRVAMWARRAEAVAEVKGAGLAEFASTDLAAVVSGAQFVVLCVPIGAMPTLARSLGPLLAPGAVVTDVGSVKGPVCAELAAILAGRADFVGSHPMAGSDRHGLAAARADLFQGAVSIVTPRADAAPGAEARVAAFWQELGCRVLQCTPEEHDEIVALISHFPHLLAATLVNTVSEANTRAFDFCGPGFRDTTRVAGGLPEMWAEILGTNREAVRRVAEALIEKLRGIITVLDRKPSMIEFLTQAKAQRDHLRLPHTPHA